MHGMIGQLSDDPRRLLLAILVFTILTVVGLCVVVLKRHLRRIRTSD